MISFSCNEINFAGNWPVYEYTELVKKDSGIDIQKAHTRDLLIAEIKAKNAEAALLKARAKKIIQAKVIAQAAITKPKVKIIKILNTAIMSSKLFQYK